MPGWLHPGFNNGDEPMHNCTHRWLCFLSHAMLFSVVNAGACAALGAQEVPTKPENPRAITSPDEADLSAGRAKVDIEPLARDAQIGERLQKVLVATQWFHDPQVRVEEGVVFLTGQADSDDLKAWAGDLAGNTQDVVAVVNRMEVPQPSVWDFSPAWSGLSMLWRDSIRSLPFLAFGLLILGVSLGAGALAVRSTATAAANAHSIATAAKRRCPRHRRAGRAFRRLHHPAGIGADATCAHGGRRHRSRRLGSGHRLSRHHRKFSRQHFSQRAEAV